MKMDKAKCNISILGCGWLGKPLAKYFIAEGYNVKGSCRSAAKVSRLLEEGIRGFEICVTDKEVIGNEKDEFFNCDILIISFPPERRPDIEEYHEMQFKCLIDTVNNTQIKYVLFTSSTSVYPDLNKEVFEDELAAPAKGSGKALKVVEEMLMQQSEFNTTIVRFGGLIGYDRMPGRFLANKKDVENGDSPVNLIHRDDCINIIYQIIMQEAWGEIYNACSDKHPTRKEYYIKAAELIGLNPPCFMEGSDNNFKIINSDKIKNRLNYTFTHPDPLELLNVESRANEHRVQI